MFGVTQWQKLMAAGAVVLGGVAAVAALIGARRLVLVLLVVSVTAAVVVLLDVRRRIGETRNALLQSFSTLGDGNALGIAAVRPSERPEHDLQELSERLDAIGRSADSLNKQQKALSRDVAALTRHQTTEIEAMFQLFGRMSSDHPMPTFGRWSIDAHDVLALITLVRRQEPRMAVELGNGASTVWLSHALETFEKARLVSFEHLAEHYQATREAIERHEVGSIAEVRLAELTPLDLLGETFPWYDPAEFADLDHIDLLFVDGPPGGVRPLATYPALPVLHDRLSNGAVLVLRDLDPADRDSVIDKWHAEFPVLHRLPVASENLVAFRYDSGT